MRERRPGEPPRTTLEALQDAGAAASALGQTIVEILETLIRRHPRRFLLAAFCGVVFIVVYFIAGAASALAMDPPNDQRPVAALQVETDRWIETTLHAYVQDREVVPVVDFERWGEPFASRRGLRGLVPVEGTWTEIRSEFVAKLVELQDRRGGSAGGREAILILLHELLHRNEHLNGTQDDRDLEEGITEAMTLDLAPAYARQVVGRRIDFEDYSGSIYDEIVLDIRGASSIATGRPWWSRAARLWRRELWAASIDGRRLMMARAEAAKAIVLHAGRSVR